MIGKFCLRIVEFVVFLAIAGAIGAMCGFVAARFGFRWLAAAIPIGVCVGVAAWVLFLYEIDRFLYRRNSN
jgi:hypothetical protein